MDREEVIESITKDNGWGERIVKDEALEELVDAAHNEGWVWGKQVPNIVKLYQRLQPDHISKEFAIALYEEIINLYMHMLEYTTIVEYPEQQETITRPAFTNREWDY